MAQYGLYPWTPAYGYRYVHPASRLLFEDVEPVDKVFELLGEAPPDADGDWLLLRHEDATFKVRPDLFSELTGPGRRLAFGFGEPVREREVAAGQTAPRHGVVGSIRWVAAQDAPRYTVWFGRRRSEREYSAHELLPEV